MGEINTGGEKVKEQTSRVSVIPRLCSRTTLNARYKTVYRWER